ncbi:MAG TPA: universal stress protein [Thermodesulfobacteriota bacterium]|nr:universal stress protein [Thermodesulfobacteriota bacterium]HOC37743.1 universal stress protein [Thermodesulfobacteriota bacterium]
MFQHILVPLDGSPLAERILLFMSRMAQVMGKRLTLLRVLEKPELFACAGPIDPLEWQLCRVEAESYLATMAQRLQEEGLEADYVLLEGDPANTIIEFIHGQDVDLILASSHGRSGLTGWNAGSVMQKVLARAHISVMIIRGYNLVREESEIAPLRKILVPLDGSKRSECALAPAVRLSQFCQASLLLAHVVHRPEMPRRTPLTPEDLELAGRIIARNQEEGWRYLEFIKSQIEGDVQTNLSVSDDVAASLHDLVREEDVDLVALCAHGYSGKARWAYGGITTSFVDYGTTPLLIVQDMPATRTEVTKAELAARESKGH